MDRSTEIQGLRYNDGKPELSFILEARHALTGLARVLEHGAKKYSRGNWRKGLPHTEIMDSMLRHIAAYMSGEDIDPESELPHADHILCNALFLSEIIRTHPQLDTRKISSEVDTPTRSEEMISFEEWNARHRVAQCGGKAHD